VHADGVNTLATTWQLRRVGADLWSSVHTRLKNGWLTVLVELRPVTESNVYDALIESQHRLRETLDEQGAGRWLATIQLGRRVSYTIRSARH
jgi:hypothetical protein